MLGENQLWRLDCWKIVAISSRTKSCRSRGGSSDKSSVILDFFEVTGFFSHLECDWTKFIEIQRIGYLVTYWSSRGFSCSVGLEKTRFPTLASMTSSRLSDNQLEVSTLAVAKPIGDCSRVVMDEGGDWKGMSSVEDVWTVSGMNWWWASQARTLGFCVSAARRPTHVARCGHCKKDLQVPTDFVRQHTLRITNNSQGLSPSVEVATGQNGEGTPP